MLMPLARAASTVETNMPQLDRSRDWLQQQIDSFSGGLDNFFIEKFFGDEILDDYSEGSKAQVSLHTRREFGGDVDYFFDGRMKLVLPHTNERLKLLISSNDDSDVSIEQDPLRNIEKATYSTALRFVFLETQKWKSDFDVGMKWKAPPDPYVRTRFRRQFQLGNWRTNLSQSFYYYVADGSGEKTDLFADLNLSDAKLLRLSSQAEYKRKNGYFEMNYAVTLYHKLKNNAVFAYGVGASGDTDDGPVFQLYHAGFRYRRLIYKDWIFAEINPQQEWNVENNYRRQAVIMFRLEALIE